MSFSFAIAALLEGRVDAAWGRWVRPWTLAAWIFLTIGIAMGSWWAYYELGWVGSGSGIRWRMPAHAVADCGGATTSAMWLRSARV